MIKTIFQKSSNKWQIGLILFPIILLFGSCKSGHKEVIYSHTALTHSKQILLYQQEPFTGVLYGLYPNHDTLFKESYADGLLNGLTKRWYPHHKPKEERWYKAGYADSTHTGWWQNGKVEFRLNYKDNSPNGRIEFWYSNGLRKSQYHYTKGEQTGIQTEWLNDGRPHKSYDVRNGIVKILIDSKSCLFVK